jgi:hypothetical protein
MDDFLEADALARVTKDRPMNQRSATFHHSQTQADSTVRMCLSL